jgi:hypothetical protein
MALLGGYPWLSGWWCNKHLEKDEFVNGKDYPMISHYTMENNKRFETTSQVSYS